MQLKVTHPFAYSAPPLPSWSHVPVTHGRGFTLGSNHSLIANFGVKAPVRKMAVTRHTARAKAVAAMSSLLAMLSVLDFAHPLYPRPRGQ